MLSGEAKQNGETISVMNFSCLPRNVDDAKAGQNKTCVNVYELLFFFFQISGPDWAPAPRRGPEAPGGLSRSQPSVCGLHEEPAHRQPAHRYGQLHR